MYEELFTEDTIHIKDAFGVFRVMQQSLDHLYDAALMRGASIHEDLRLGQIPDSSLGTTLQGLFLVIGFHSISMLSEFGMFWCFELEELDDTWRDLLSEFLTSAGVEGMNMRQSAEDFVGRYPLAHIGRVVLPKPILGDPQEPRSIGASDLRIRWVNFSVGYPLEGGLGI